MKALGKGLLIVALLAAGMSHVTAQPGGEGDDVSELRRKLVEIADASNLFGFGIFVDSPTTISTKYGSLELHVELIPLKGLGHNWLFDGVSYLDDQERPIFLIYNLDIYLTGVLSDGQYREIENCTDQEIKGDPKRIPFDVTCLSSRPEADDEPKIVVAPLTVYVLGNVRGKQPIFYYMNPEKAVASLREEEDIQRVDWFSHDDIAKGLYTSKLIHFSSMEPVERRENLWAFYISIWPVDDQMIAADN